MDEIDLSAIDWGDNGLQSYEDYLNQFTDSSGNYDFLGAVGDNPLISGGSGILDSILGGGSSLLKLLSGSGGSTAAGLAGALLGGLGSNASWAQPQVQKTGYQGGIPSYEAVRAPVPGTYDPTRRPGSRGQEYFTPTQYSSPTDVATAKATAAQQATEAEARNKAREAEYKQAQPVAEYAGGGLAMLAKGRYLQGPGDGMSDSIPASIDGKQDARLATSEFVVPADVVSHIGNGSSEAGAKRLYDMIDKIRKARTGTTKQGKQINPNKYLPG